MAGGVPRSVDGHDPAVIADRVAPRKLAERALVERKRLRGKPRGQRLAQDAAHHARHRRCEELQLRVVDQDSRVHVNQPVDVVSVGVGEHHLRDVVELQAGGGDRRRKLLLAGYFHARERDVPRRGCLTGVNQPQHPVVLDRPAVDRQRL